MKKGWRITSAGLKLRCDERFTHAFTACSCVFKVITLVGLNQGNFFENVIACSKHMRKTLVATQLYFCSGTGLTLAKKY